MYVRQVEDELHSEHLDNTKNLNNLLVTKQSGCREPSLAMKVVRAGESQIPKPPLKPQRLPSPICTERNLGKSIPYPFTPTYYSIHTHHSKHQNYYFQYKSLQVKVTVL